jgi:uncharacterized protein
MPRPRCCRRVAGEPQVTVFKPAGVPRVLLAEVVMTLDELEALRLADLEGMYQERAAERMGVSRSTFGRTVETARRKVATALVEGHALRIEGGVVEVVRENLHARRCGRGSPETAEGAGRRCGWRGRGLDGGGYAVTRRG